MSRDINQPIGDQVNKLESLVLEHTIGNDSKLPKRRSAGSSLKREQKLAELRLIELRKLEQVFANGGLVPTYAGPQHWMCDACHRITTDKSLAKQCCGQGAVRVNVCTNCGRRAADCICVSKFGNLNNEKEKS
jgi:hypothetical protein